MPLWPLPERCWKKGFDVIYVSSPDFFSKLEALHFGSDPAGEEEMLLRTAAGADLLILDDLGSEFNSSFPHQHPLYSLLNNRLGAKLPTIVTTNITDGALLEKLYTEKNLQPPLLFCPLPLYGRRYSGAKGRRSVNRIEVKESSYSGKEFQIWES